MRIRIEIPTPYRFVIEEGASYPPMVVEDEPHNITVLPPIASPIVQTDQAWSPLRGKKSFQADTLVVEVNADEINVSNENLRRNNVAPLVERAFEWANWFLMRYRDYTQAYFIQPVVRWQMCYSINYYPVEESATAIVNREERNIHKILSTYLLPEIWEGVSNLDRSYETPPWIHLLLDARFAAHSGVGVVLAWAALEMVIDHALEVLLKHSRIPSGLWNWLTTRNNYWQQPATEEQYSVLLEALCGRSLKEEKALWQNFKELKKLRNQFAHGGKLELNGKPVPKQRIEFLIRSARDIVAFVNEQLPPQSKWRMFPEYTGPYGGFAGLSVGPQEAADF